MGRHPLITGVIPLKSFLSNELLMANAHFNLSILSACVGPGSVQTKQVTIVLDEVVHPPRVQDPREIGDQPRISPKNLVD